MIRKKIGIPLSVNCINPITNESIPLYIANFVLDNYGEGAIFGALPMMNEILNLPKNTSSLSKKLLNAAMISYHTLGMGKSLIRLF